MYYSIRHLTKFLYSNPVSESMMETRMHPRSDQNQRCLTFHLSVSPRCRVFSYRDHLANQVHHFDIPGQHGQLVVVAESLVEVQPAPQVPSFLAPGAWDELDSLAQYCRQPIHGMTLLRRVRGEHSHSHLRRLPGLPDMPMALHTLVADRSATAHSGWSAEVTPVRGDNEQ